MYEILNRLRVFEAASFVAAPFAAMQLAQLGAEVIRIDPVGGGPDFRRWPLAPSGESFFWEGLNKSKKSVTINLADPEGRELAQALITAPDSDGREAGLFVTNFPQKSFLSHENLSRRRRDLITLRVLGWPDGGQAVDYTINPAVGLPTMTGPVDPSSAPVNHVLPAWDLLTGSTGAFSLMAAREKRRQTGEGGEIRLPLSDVAASTLANLGMLAEVLTSQRDRPRIGNTLFGAFGRDFTTADGEAVMIVGLTTKQWRAIIAALDLGDVVTSIEARLGLLLDQEAGLRFTHRAVLEEIVERAVASRYWAELEARLIKHGVCYGRYRSLLEASGDAIFLDSPVFSTISQPSGETYPAPGFVAGLVNSDRQPARPAPRLGADTAEVLYGCLGLPDHAIADMAARGLIGTPVD